MRGKAKSDYLGPLEGRITPAYAGKSFIFFRSSFLSADHPRVCGEKSERTNWTTTIQGSPPRMRGKVIQLSGPLNAPGDHPRVCGEKYAVFQIYLSSGRITPAYAGKSHHRPSSDRLPTDHPRVCGEKLLAINSRATLGGSPPRMRGKGLTAGQGGIPSRITPAYAGKSSCLLLLFDSWWDHPRVCGEKISPARLSPRRGGSPPRMRGKEHYKHTGKIGIRITPAYAGKSGAE